MQHADDALDDAPRIAFWCRMAQQFGGPVLALDCGNGDVAIAIAARGLAVTGVDADARLLAQARARGERDDVDARWLHAEPATLALPRRFGFVLLATGTLADPATPADPQALLATVRRHLAPEGVFGFEASEGASHAEAVEDCLAAAGFEPVAQYGDWDFARARAGAPRLIVLCRIRAGA